jgi:hypothetical protein
MTFKYKAVATAASLIIASLRAIISLRGDGQPQAVHRS